jgi:hypothetical protein
MALLQKGPKYNLHTKKKDWIQNLALETETAISQLPPPQTEIYTENWLLSASTTSYKTTTPELNKTHTLRPEPSNPSKLSHNEAMIARADKGNSLVIF